MGEENKLILKVYSKVLTLLNPVAKNCGEEVVVEILKSAIEHYKSVESISNEKVNKEENESNSKSGYEKDKMGGFYGLVASTSNDSVDEEEKEKYYEDIRKQKKYDSPKIEEINSYESDDINKFGKVYRDLVNARENKEKEESTSKIENSENSIIYEQTPEVLEKVAADRRNNPVAEAIPNKTEEVVKEEQPEEERDIIEGPKEESVAEVEKAYTKVLEPSSTVTWNADVASPGTLFK